MALPMPQPRQGRLGSRKSTNGCITCKIRKVKCDELRPACKRCLSTGRKCDGYIHDSNLQIRPPAVNSAMATVKYPKTYANVEQAEVQSFEFFIRRVVPGFTRIVDEHFWHQLIPQLSHSDPVIWDAVNALACLVQHPQYSSAFVLPGSQKAPVTNEEHRRALKWYSKSITGLQERMSHGMTWSATTVITCILYICIECLQDNTTEAVALSQRAVAMMEMIAEDEHGHRSKTQSGNSLENTIRALLRHMSISQGLPVKRRKILDYSEDTFQSLSDAREELYVLIGEAHEFILHVGAIKLMQVKDWTASSDLISRQKCIEAKFLQWHSAVGNTINSPRSVSGLNEDELYSVLLVAYSHYCIWLSTCLSTYETAFDSFFPAFQSMIEHASRATAAKKTEPAPVFIFETRIVPSLFFVATKCRHPIIRRQAISLLRNGTRIENISKAEAMAEVAERDIGIEESGSEHGVFCLTAHSMVLPPESHRVYRQAIVELQDSYGRPARFLKFGRWQQDESRAWFQSEHLVKM